MNYISNKKIKDMTKKHLFQNGLALFVCLFLFAGAVFAQSQTVRVDYSGNGSSTWNVPTSLNGNPITVTSVTFEAWGGGGAGGFCDGGHTLFDMVVSGAGGGGAYGRTVVNNPTAGEAFSLSIGAGGYNTADDASGTLQVFSKYTNRREAHGGTTTVKRNGTTILEAKGGYTCSGINNTTGANGGENTGAGQFHNAGGKGGNGEASCTLAGRRSSGGGGGAAGPNGNGGNGGNGVCSANNGRGEPGIGGGSAAGNGGRGTSDHNDVWGGEPVGAPGNTFGGGGGGTKSAASWHSGGAGANGGILITYTYVTSPVAENVSITNGSTTICSGADFDVTLNITATNFNLANASVIPSGVSVTGLNISAGTVYKTSDGKWHLTGSATNTTYGTLTATIPVTVTTPSGNASDNATITVNVYGKLNGGVIAADQFVCQDQTIQIIKGNGDVVYSSSYNENVTTAPATGGSGDGDYQWLKKDIFAGDANFQPISGTNSANYTPSTGYAYYERTYTDNVCGTTVTASDGFDGNYVYLVSVNPFNPGNLSGTDNICPNEAFTKTLGITEITSPTTANVYARWNVYWQKSTDNGTTWTNVASNDNLSFTNALAYTYTINVGAGELTPGEIQYRYALETVYDGTTCTMVTCNGVYKLIVGAEGTDYTGQFPDINITLWYGACDTSIANIEAPALDPTPASVTRTDALNRVGVGEYNIVWTITENSDCENVPTEYTQKVIVKYPDCGTVENPDAFPASDAQGIEYKTIRIGCECWLAENLKTNSGLASYYNEDPTNESFGKLYSWNDAVAVNNTEMTAMTGAKYIQGVCPEGWSIPSVGQYNTMMSNVEGTDAIKSDDQSTWLPGNAGTNAAGFAAMGAGYYEAMQYQRQLGYTYFWTADLNPSNNTVAKVMELRCGCDELTCTEKSKEAKVSVRCVRVEPVSVPL